MVDQELREGVVRCRMVVCSGFVLQAEDGIRDLVRSRGLGDVDKRQSTASAWVRAWASTPMTNGRVCATIDMVIDVPSS